jgi:phosphonate transport system substrate-binding protein
VVLSPLTFTSCQAPSAYPFCAAAVRLISGTLDVPAEFLTDGTWQAREAAFDRGDIDVCWMCGWPYAERADRAPGALELLAAPVMADARYLDQPIYFSDVIVREDSRFHAFEDLRGASWAYNEPKSHSGYNVVRYGLARRHIDGPFFGRVIPSGSHAASIDLVLDGTVDASAIDSTVLGAAGRARPDIVPRLRVVDTLGPSPAPPWVMRSSLASGVRDDVRTAFLTLHENAEGRTLLQQAGMRRFAAVSDQDYDPIREMAALAATIRL